MPTKNIVICADGTGNSAIKDRGTNVFKLYEAVDQNDYRRGVGNEKNPQIAIYHDGVGTESVRWWSLATGAFGIGLARSVRELYESLARVYEPGDRIFLFGFSRGAFAVRTLAGLIAKCGVLRPKAGTGAVDLGRTVKQAYRWYRQGYRPELIRWIFGDPAKVRLDDGVKKFRSEHAWDEGPTGTPIEFIGVWDTVDAVGGPFLLTQAVNTFLYQFKFPSQTLSPVVRRACHALALDEQRKSFRPVLWELGTGDEQRIEQVWFAGVHSNVGGGYAKQGMSLVALDWMMHRAAQSGLRAEHGGRPAEQRGLRFIPEDRDYYQKHHSVNDRLSDSRAGLGLFYPWEPRNVRELCEAAKAAPSIHTSVFERIARSTDGYAPGNIPPHCQVVPTQHPVERLAEVAPFVLKQHEGKLSLLEQMQRYVKMGTLSYNLFLMTVGWSALWTAVTLLREKGMAGLGDVGWVDVLKAFGSNPYVLGAVLGLLCVAYLLAERVDGQMGRTFSEFWSRQQGELRKMLGL